MPIHEFRCPKCDEVFEEILLSSEEAAPPMPQVRP